ncbi:peptidoglycan DD-metalloendopeptidase family protein [Halioxenophilus aromaticivorans]|uniref:M23 family metallopeptidase n=1 Tax=Halioxenophilus aromaticivorans TaxID=1306992 RepID=A0AAV3TZ81_9ALTE
MKIIVLNKGLTPTKTYNLDVSGWTKALLSVCLIGLPLGLGVALGAMINSGNSAIEVTENDNAQEWQEALAQQQAEIDQSKREAEAQLAAMTLRVAELQARLQRIDAVGERLTQAAKLDAGEFNFNEVPALGGPEEFSESINFEPPTFMTVLDEISAQIDNREMQLNTLEILMSDRQIQDDTFLAGRPIKKGWMSSRYGRRTDPFNGKLAWHKGVDFAGKENAEIIAVAGGVITWSGERYGYGNMVEVTHGSGMATRYAHNKENLVKVGEVVKKGQTLALMGSSGRSTGPHVHFEVYKNGRPVDPASYIHRTPRK